MNELRRLRESALFSVYRDNCLLVARNGRFIGHAKNGIFGFPVPITMKNQVLLNQLPLVERGAIKEAV
jgi:hypothetical protein